MTDIDKVREEIAEVIRLAQADLISFTNTGNDLKNSSRDYADKILALLTGKWEVVEECPFAPHIGEEYLVPCFECSGSGTITRPATIEEIEEALEAWQGRDNYLLKSGGRLRRKEADDVLQ